MTDIEISLGHVNGRPCLCSSSESMNDAIACMREFVTVQIEHWLGEYPSGMSLESYLLGSTLSHDGHYDVTCDIIELTTFALMEGLEMKTTIICNNCGSKKVGRPKTHGITGTIYEALRVDEVIVRKDTCEECSIVDKQPSLWEDG